MILSGYSDFSAMVILLAVLGHNKMLDGLSSEKNYKQIFLVTLATDSYEPKTNDSKPDY